MAVIYVSVWHSLGVSRLSVAWSETLTRLHVLQFWQASAFIEPQETPLTILSSSHVFCQRTQPPHGFFTSGFFPSSLPSSSSFLKNRTLSSWLGHPFDRCWTSVAICPYKMVPGRPERWIPPNDITRTHNIYTTGAAFQRNWILASVGLGKEGSCLGFNMGIMERVFFFFFKVRVLRRRLQI